MIKASHGMFDINPETLPEERNRNIEIKTRRRKRSTLATVATDRSWVAAGHVARSCVPTANSCQVRSSPSRKSQAAARVEGLAMMAIAKVFFSPCLQ